ncbi:MAG: MlaD family protein [Bacteroidota bacterium]
MKADTSKKVKTGIFVIVGFGIALLLVFFIGSQQNLFQSTSRLHINYRTVVGLKEGAFVRFNGINAGVVELIDLVDDTTVRVEITVQKKIMPFIKADSRANISTDGLMGDKLIQILPGQLNAEPIKNNAELIAINPLDMDKVMSRVEKVSVKIEGIVSNIDTLSGSLANIFNKVNKGEGTLGKLVNNTKMSDDIEQTITNAKKTAKTADEAAQGLKENMEAAKNNFLLRGYFKKKEKKRIKDSIARAKKLTEKDNKEEADN